MNWINGQLIFYKTDYDKWQSILEKAYIDEDEFEFWYENLFKRLPSENPKRLFNTIIKIEDEGEWFFHTVDKDLNIVFDKPLNYAQLTFSSLEDMEHYIYIKIFNLKYLIMKIKESTYKKHVKKEAKLFIKAVNEITSILEKSGLDSSTNNPIWKAIDECVLINTRGYEYCYRNEIDLQDYFENLENNMFDD